MARRDAEEEIEAQRQAGLSNGTAVLAEATSEKPKRKKREVDPNDPNALVSVMVRLPQGLKTQVDATATNQDVSTPQTIARMIAEAYEYTLPVMATRARVQKYASVEERKQAQKDKRDADRMRVKAILSAVDNGLLGDIDVNALVERMKQEQAAKAASDGATQELATAGAAS